MAKHLQPIPHRAVTDELHPIVYRSIIGLTVWLVLSVWALFSRGTYEGLTLSVITLFFVVLVGIPLALWQSWQRNTQPEARHNDCAPFRQWTSYTFETWTGGVSGLEAAMQILLPLAAVAIGMTVFGLVFLFAVPNLTS
jgi:hypothetical protein